MDPCCGLGTGHQGSADRTREHTESLEPGDSTRVCSNTALLRSPWEPTTTETPRPPSSRERRPGQDGAWSPKAAESPSLSSRVGGLPSAPAAEEQGRWAPKGADELPPLLERPQETQSRKGQRTMVKKNEVNSCPVSRLSDTSARLHPQFLPPAGGGEGQPIGLHALIPTAQAHRGAPRGPARAGLGILGRKTSHPSPPGWPRAPSVPAQGLGHGWGLAETPHLQAGRQELLRGSPAPSPRPGFTSPSYRTVPLGFPGKTLHPASFTISSL